jgi:hypothetical protein
VIAAAGLYFGAKTGAIAGVAIVMTVAQFVSMVAGWSMARKILSVGLPDLAHAVRGPGLAAVFSLAVGLALLRVLPDGGSVPALVGAAVTLAAVYLLSWWLVDARFRLDVRELLGRGQIPADHNAREGK